MFPVFGGCGWFPPQVVPAAAWSAVLLRLVYLSVTGVFGLLRLLPVSDRDKDIEILWLRHQIAVLQRHLGTARPRFSPADRAFLAALLHRLPRGMLGQIQLLMRPDTVLRWHRDLLAQRHAAMSRPRRHGRPRTVHSVRLLVLRLARENPSWGYRRIHGELLVLGIKTAASTVWEILRQAGIDPAPDRTSSTWASFLRSQADALLACDFFETSTLGGTRQFVLAVIDHATRRIRILGATPHPTASWVTACYRCLELRRRGGPCKRPFLERKISVDVDLRGRYVLKSGPARVRSRQNRCRSAIPSRSCGAEYEASCA